MKQPKTKRQEHYKQVLSELFLKNPEAKKVALRYKTLAYTLNKEWANLMSGSESWDNFLRDVIYLDRQLRLMTEGDETELKEILSQEWQIENGYEAGSTVKLDI